MRQNENPYTTLIIAILLGAQTSLAGDLSSMSLYELEGAAHLFISCNEIEYHSGELECISQSTNVTSVDQDLLWSIDTVYRLKDSEIESMTNDICKNKPDLKNVGKIFAPIDRGAQLHDYYKKVCLCKSSKDRKSCLVDAIKSHKNSRLCKISAMPPIKFRVKKVAKGLWEGSIANTGICHWLEKNQIRSLAIRNGIEEFEYTHTQNKSKSQSDFCKDFKNHIEHKYVSASVGKFYRFDCDVFQFFP